MPGGKDSPEELLHREPRQRAPREDLRVHRLKVEDSDLEPPSKKGELSMKTTASVTPQFHKRATEVLGRVAEKLEKAGSKLAATLLDRVANELDLAQKGSLTVAQKRVICQNLDRVAGGLQKAGATESAELIDRVQNDLDSLFSDSEGGSSPATTAGKEEECEGCSDLTPDAEEVVSDLEEEALAEKGGPSESDSDVVVVRLASTVRLTGESDKNGFRTPTFVKQATHLKWAEAVQKLVDSGKGYHQDGTPNYGRAIDQYKASI